MKKQYQNQEQSFSELLSVVAYEEQSKLFIHDDKHLGFAFVCQPLTGVNNNILSQLKSLLQQDLPVNSYLSFLLWSHCDLKPLLDRHGELVFSLEQDSILAQQDLAQQQLFQQLAFQENNVNGKLLKDFVLLISIKIPYKEQVFTSQALDPFQNLRLAFFNQLQSIGFAPLSMDAQLWVYYIRVILNPAQENLDNLDIRPNWQEPLGILLDEQKLLKQQVFDFDTKLQVRSKYLQINNEYINSFSVYNWPTNFNFGQAWSYLGDSWDGSTALTNKFLICCNIFYGDQSSVQQKFEIKRKWTINQAFGPLVKFISRIAKARHMFDYIHEDLQNGDKLLALNWTLHTWHSSEQQLVAATNKIKSYFQTLDFLLNQDSFINLPLFINSLPLCVDPKAKNVLMRYRTFSSSQAVNALPIFADWKGSYSPLLQLVSRQGQLMGANLFDSNTNFNCLIAAQSGAGKSFLVNELITNLLSAGAKVWVIDVGKSYKNLCDYYQGSFLDFAEQQALNLNPFALLEDFTQDIDLVISLLSCIISESGDLSDFQLSSLKEIITELWQEHQAQLQKEREQNSLFSPDLITASELSLDTLAHALKAHSDPRLNDLGTQLYPFLSKGNYGALFNSQHKKIEDNLDQEQNFTVLELEHFNSRPHLKKIVLLQLIMVIQQQMLQGNKEQEKVLFIDEAWDMLASQGIANFIELGYRRFRKYNGSIVLITQSLDDIYSSEVGRAIVSNSAHLYLLSQRPEVIANLVKEEKLVLSAGLVNQINSLRTVKHAYSEIFLQTPYGSGVGRLIVNPFKQILYSTDARISQRLQNLQAQGHDLLQAIAIILGDKNG